MPALSPCLCVALSTTSGPAGANPLPPSPRPCNSAHAPSAVCSAAFRDQPQGLAPSYQPGPGPTRPRPPTLCSRFGLAAAASDLGGRLYRNALGRQPSRHRPAQRTYPATLVSPPATTPSPGRAADPKRTWAERPRAPRYPGRWTPGEQLRLGSGQGISWLRLVDEVQWRLPGHHGFPPTTTGPTSRRPTCSGRCGQRFARWGLPRRLRVDNGKPWGSWATCRRRWRCG